MRLTTHLRNEFFDIAIIGLGPAGIAAGKLLSDTVDINRIICIEQGSVNDIGDCSLFYENVCCDANECHIITGLGGASKLSSGKLSMYPAGSGLARFFDSEEQFHDIMQAVLRYFENGMTLRKIKVPKEKQEEIKQYYRKFDIEYKYYDVYEFEGDAFRSCIQKEWETLTQKHVNILSGTKVTNVEMTQEGKYKLFFANAETSGCIVAKKIIIATGGLDSQNLLLKSSLGKPNYSCEYGVRIEVKKKILKDLYLQHGDLKLKYRNGRTYCVTENGGIVTYKINGMHFLEGSIDYAKSDNKTNMAVLIKEKDKEEIYSFLNRYKMLFHGTPIIQRYEDYYNRVLTNADIETTCKIATKNNIENLFSQRVNEELIDFIEVVLIKSMNVDRSEINLVAPEFKVLNELDMDNNFELLPGCFVIGAASGVFRGIIQSICSGIRCAMYLMGG